MNLDSCTPAQREIITTLNQPLMVSAGAGSGKTFTLTQRIAYALQAGAENGGINGVDELVAITFTKKAAAELKARVKRQLLSMGYTEQALQVDSAWISTIHSMGARILREHAVELGLDPNFTELDEAQQKRYYHQAIDEVLGALKGESEQDWQARCAACGLTVTADSRAALAQYVAEVGVTTQGYNASSIPDYIEALNKTVQALPAGVEALQIQECTVSPSELLRRLVVIAEQFYAELMALSKPTTTDAQRIQEVEKALCDASSYLESGAAGDSFLDTKFDATRFARVFFAFPPTSKTYHTKASDSGIFMEYRQTYATLASEAIAALAAREYNHLVVLARLIEQAYMRIKGPAALDNTDLLRRTYYALTEHPAIAQAYQQQFNLIMIDEFQDTDELQLALIRMLAKPDLSNVCTVGDAQQSIYRFRGADVNVFFGYRQRLQALDDAKFVSLPDNFRSHASVLSLVDTIFSQQEVFGNEFLSLKPAGAVNNQPDAVFDEYPRLTCAVFDYRRFKGAAQQARTESATRIANHFSALRAKGASPSDMAILLGTMEHADVYAQALRAAGLECVVAGGSTFTKAPEVELLQYAARLLANPLDSEALYVVLTSPLFEVGASAMLALATATKPVTSTSSLYTPHTYEALTRRRSLSRGFAAYQDERDTLPLERAEADRLDFAYQCIQNACSVAQTSGLGAGLQYLLRASGWFIRLSEQGAEGQAQAGNCYKALRMIHTIEVPRATQAAQGSAALGLADVAEEFINQCSAAKINPGTLATTSSNFVRLMTVHASKGLEFEHVALADMRLAPKWEALAAEAVEGSVYVTFTKPHSLDESASKKWNKVKAFAEPLAGSAEALTQAQSLGEQAQALDAYVNAQEVGECHRLLYVALTRASKSLLVCVEHEGNKDFDYTKKGILNDLYTALRWQASAEAPVQQLTCTDGTPVRFELTVLTKPQAGHTLAAGEGAASAESTDAAAAGAAQGVQGAATAEAAESAQGAASVGAAQGTQASATPGSSEQVVGGKVSAGKPTFAIPAHSVPKAAYSVPFCAEHPEVASYSSLAHSAGAPSLAEYYAHAAPQSETPLFGEELTEEDGDATALGSAFHYLAQRAIATYKPDEQTPAALACPLACPPEQAIAACVQTLGVTPAQEVRLRAALDRWFESNVACELVQTGAPQAEVPFMVALGNPQTPVFLEGEIDALAISDTGSVLVVDYKTGGSPHEPHDWLFQKHLLQAQCYALALLKQGYTRVTLKFVRVEQESAETPGQPEVVSYTFTASDAEGLEQTVSALFAQR